jgi:hypothetical protein
MIRNGRGLMPSYNRIEEVERWDIVNYVRGLQGRYPVDTTMARPGVTGNALPSASLSAPTRAAPYFNAVRGVAMGALVGGSRAAGSAPGAAAAPAPASPPSGQRGDTAAAPAPARADTTTARGARRP